MSTIGEYEKLQAGLKGPVKEDVWDDMDSSNKYRLEGLDAPEIYHDVDPSKSNVRNKVYKQIADLNNITEEQAKIDVDNQALALANDPTLPAKLAQYRRDGTMPKNAEFTSFEIYNAGDQSKNFAKKDALLNPNTAYNLGEKFDTGRKGFYNRNLVRNEEFTKRALESGYAVAGEGDKKKYELQLKSMERAKELKLGNYGKSGVDPRVMDAIYKTSYAKAENDEAIRRSNESSISPMVDAVQTGFKRDIMYPVIGAFGRLMEGTADASQGEDKVYGDGDNSVNSIGNWLRSTGEAIQDFSDKGSENAAINSGYKNTGNKMVGAIAKELVNGNFGKAYDKLDVDASIELAGEGIPFLLALGVKKIKNTAGLPVVFAGQVNEGLKAAEEESLTGEISNGRKAVVIAGEALSLALESFGIDVILGKKSIPMIKDAISDVASKVGDKIPKNVLTDAAGYVTKKMLGLIGVAGTEAVTEASQDTVRMLTTKLGKDVETEGKNALEVASDVASSGEDLLTKENAESLIGSAVGGGIAGPILSAPSTIVGDIKKSGEVEPVAKSKLFTKEDSIVDSIASLGTAEAFRTSKSREEILAKFTGNGQRVLTPQQKRAVSVQYNAFRKLEKKLNSTENAAELAAIDESTLSPISRKMVQDAKANLKINTPGSSDTNTDTSNADTTAETSNTEANTNTDTNTETNTETSTEANTETNSTNNDTASDTVNDTNNDTVNSTNEAEVSTEQTRDYKFYKQGQTIKNQEEANIAADAIRVTNGEQAASDILEGFADSIDGKDKSFANPAVDTNINEDINTENVSTENVSTENINTENTDTASISEDTNKEPVNTTPYPDATPSKKDEVRAEFKKTKGSGKQVENLFPENKIEESAAISKYGQGGDTTQKQYDKAVFQEMKKIFKGAKESLTSSNVAVNRLSKQEQDVALQHAAVYTIDYLNSETVFDEKLGKDVEVDPDLTKNNLYRNLGNVISKRLNKSLSAKESTEMGKELFESIVSTGAIEIETNKADPKKRGSRTTVTAKVVGGAAIPKGDTVLKSMKREMFPSSIETAELGTEGKSTKLKTRSTGSKDGSSKYSWNQQSAVDLQSDVQFELEPSINIGKSLDLLEDTSIKYPAQIAKAMRARIAGLKTELSDIQLAKSAMGDKLKNMRFTAFMGGNGRDYFHGNVLNPHVDGRFSRAMLSFKNLLDVEMDNPSHMLEFKKSIVWAIDKSVDIEKDTIADIEKSFDKIMSNVDADTEITQQELVKLARDGRNIYVAPAHESLVSYAKALASGSKTFKSIAKVDMDALSSGTILMNTQAMDLDKGSHEMFMTMGGIVVDGATVPKGVDPYTVFLPKGKSAIKSDVKSLNVLTENMGRDIIKLMAMGIQYGQGIGKAKVTMAEELNIKLLTDYVTSKDKEYVENIEKFYNEMGVTDLMKPFPAGVEQNILNTFVADIGGPIGMSFDDRMEHINVFKTHIGNYYNGLITVKNALDAAGIDNSADVLRVPAYASDIKDRKTWQNVAKFDSKESNITVDSFGESIPMIDVKLDSSLTNAVVNLIHRMDNEIKSAAINLAKERMEKDGIDTMNFVHIFDGYMTDHVAAPYLRQAYNEVSLQITKEYSIDEAYQEAMAGLSKTVNDIVRESGVTLSKQDTDAIRNIIKDQQSEVTALNADMSKEIFHARANTFDKVKAENIQHMPEAKPGNKVESGDKAETTQSTHDTMSNKDDTNPFDVTKVELSAEHQKEVDSIMKKLTSGLSKEVKKELVNKIKECGGF